MANKKNSSNKKSSSPTKKSNIVETENGDGIEVGIGISNYVFIFICLVAIALIIYFIVRRKDDTVKKITGDYDSTEPVQQPPVQQPPAPLPPVQIPNQDIDDTTQPTKDDPTDPENSHKFLFPIALVFFIVAVILGILFMIRVIPTVRQAINEIQMIGDLSQDAGVIKRGSAALKNAGVRGIQVLFGVEHDGKFCAISIIMVLISVIFASVSIGHSVHKSACAFMLVLEVLFIIALFIYLLVKYKKVQKLITLLYNILNYFTFKPGTPVSGDVTTLVPYDPSVGGPQKPPSTPVLPLPTPTPTPTPTPSNSKKGSCKIVKRNPQ